MFTLSFSLSLSLSLPLSLPPPLTLGLWFCRCELFRLQYSLCVSDGLGGHMIHCWFIDILLAGSSGRLGCGCWLHLLWNAVLLQFGRCVSRVYRSQKAEQEIYCKCGINCAIFIILCTVDLKIPYAR